MAELKTKKNDGSVNDFINAVEDEKKRDDSFQILNLMQEITDSEPKMWGESIVGFGNYEYKYKTGRTGKWFLCGFSPRKQNLTIYLMSGFTKLEKPLAKLGKYKTGKGCLYIKKLEDIDIDTLKKIIQESVGSLTKES